MRQFRILCEWALQIGYCRDIWRLGNIGNIPGIFDGWSRKSASNRAREISILKSNNPITRAGNAG